MLLRKKLTARRLFSSQSSEQELTNRTGKSTKTSHVNPANRKNTFTSVGGGGGGACV